LGLCLDWLCQWHSRGQYLQALETEEQVQPQRLPERWGQRCKVRCHYTHCKRYCKESDARPASPLLPRTNRKRRLRPSPQRKLDPPRGVQKNILEILTYLDTILPSGSHVLMTGLAQGSVLWDFMHNRTHPIGTTYANVYHFLNCMHASPCWAWMNSNATVREAGDKRAAELSAMYPDIVANYTFKHFDMMYHPFPFKEIVSMWTNMGGQPWQLIEPSDGFHPNQISNWLTAQFTAKILPESWLGPINPNNAKINAIFGDQGGY